MPISTSGPTTARSSSTRITKTTSEHDRRDHRRVPGRGLAHVELDRGRAADQHRRPRRRRRRRRGSARSGRTPRSSTAAASASPAAACGRRRRCATGGADRLDARHVGDRRRHALDVGGVGDDDVGRRARAGREALGQQLLALRPTRPRCGSCRWWSGRSRRTSGRGTSRAGSPTAPTKVRSGLTATRSPTRFQKPCVASTWCSCWTRRSSYGVNTGPSSSDTIDGTRRARDACGRTP